jgi:hypothetical protein
MSKVEAKVLNAVKGDSDIVTLNRGFKVKVTQLPISVFDAVLDRFPMPNPPEVEIAEKGRSEPNPNDPDYIIACNKVEGDRGEALLTAICLLCVEPVDAIPNSDTWLPQLQRLAKITGVPNLDSFDLSDPLDYKLVYLKYVAIGRSHTAAVSRFAHLGEEAIKQAEETFRGDETRPADSDGQD